MSVKQKEDEKEFRKLIHKDEVVLQRVNDSVGTPYAPDLASSLSELDMFKNDDDVKNSISRLKEEGLVNVSATEPTPGNINDGEYLQINSENYALYMEQYDLLEVPYSSNEKIVKLEQRVEELEKQANTNTARIRDVESAVQDLKDKFKEHCKEARRQFSKIKNVVKGLTQSD